MDTAPLPRVVGDEPPGHSLTGAGRAVEVLAGVVSAGLVLLGLALVFLQLFASDLAPGGGLAAATGPTWPRALAPLVVGCVGEALVWLRAKLSPGARVWAAFGLLVAASAVLWWCWWR